MPLTRCAPRWPRLRAVCLRSAAHRVESALLVAGLFLAVPAECPAQECDPELLAVTELGARVDIGSRYQDVKVLSASKRRESVSHQEPANPIRYMRVSLRLIDPGEATWHLTVRDVDYHVVQTLGPEDFTSRRTDSLWTTRVAGDWVWFDFDVASEGETAEIRLEDYIAMPASAERPYYSYQDPGKKGIQPLYEGAEHHRRLGDSVAFLMGSWGPKAWCCSGIMITPDLLLTNWHCGGVPPMIEAAYWQGARCRDLIIDLSWDDDAIDREYVCTAIEAADKALDYAVIRVRPLLKKDTVRPVRIRSARVGPSEAITIVHHPACMPKQISSDCRTELGEYQGWVDRCTHTEFSHRCDTEGGSSGAPVLDQSGLLVGLHHLGFDCDPNTKTYSDSVNKAVHLGAILETLPAALRTEILPPSGAEDLMVPHEMRAEHSCIGQHSPHPGQP